MARRIPHIRTRLLRAFLTFSVIGLGGILVLSWIIDQRQKKLAVLLSDLKSLQQEHYENALLSKSFFLHDAQNVAFHSTGESKYLQLKQHSDEAVLERVNALLGTHELLSAADSAMLLSILSDQQMHAELLAGIVAMLEKRGMEDHGLEGKMRAYAHALESSPVVPMEDLLSLRRVEKDYIIRNQEKYVDRLNERVARMLQRAARSESAAADSAFRTLTAYRDAFQRIVALDRRIGVRDHSGDFARLVALEARLTEQIGLVLRSGETRLARTEQELFIGYLASVGAFLLLSIVYAFLVSRRIATPIKDLAASVQQFASSDLRDIGPPPPIRPRDVEMAELADHFGRMQQEIRGHILGLNERVRERTQALEQEKELVQSKNDEITASLRYARGIQQSMLGISRSIAELLPESFLMNVPRDIVGGDFTWTHAMGNGTERRTYFAVADCTGHGVPASLMSVMFHHALNEAVKDLRHPSPAAILEHVNGSCAWLYGAEHGIHPGDGMSISLCMVDPHTLTLTFAGSLQSIFIHANGELHRIKGARRSIGAGLKDMGYERFQDHQVQLGHGDMVYLFSDGFADQFGGEQGRKFNAGNFKRLLAHAARLPLAHQHKFFMDTFQAWKGAHDQVDDVMVMGVQLRRAALAAGEQQAA
jgi:serine phosphatase RsbU (regulator of sigma subunit)